MIPINLNPTPRTLRNFGLIGLVAFSAFAAMVHYQIGLFRLVPENATRGTACALAGLAAYCVLFALAAPAALRWLYVTLTVLTYPIGFLASCLVMILFFYLVITPFGILFRLIGRDAMHRSFDPSATTYWIPRSPPANVKRYFRQF